LDKTKPSRTLADSGELCSYLLGSNGETRGLKGRQKGEWSGCLWVLKPGSSCREGPEGYVAGRCERSAAGKGCCLKRGMMS
jgi:hypothetical protein